MNSINPREQFTSYAILAGVWAGLLGGAGMAVVLMSHSAYVGLGWLFPLQLGSGVLLGANAILGGPLPTIVGLFLFAICSATIGLGFSLLVPPRTTTGNATVAGAIFGFSVWMAVTYLLLPVLNPAMSDRIALSPAAWFFSYMCFGALLGATPSIRKYYTDRDGVLENYEFEQRDAA